MFYISVGGERRVSFPAEDDMIGGFLGPGDSLEDLEFLAKKSEKELTHFSEEGIADMDIPDHLLEELDFLDNITSCDKVENIIIIIIIIIPKIKSPYSLSSHNDPGGELPDAQRVRAELDQGDRGARGGEYRAPGSPYSFFFLTSGPGKASKKVEPGETGEQHAG